MKLYIKNKLGKKIILTPSVKSRFELEKMLNSRFFVLNDSGSDFEYNINEVIAEPEPDTTIGTFLFAFLFILLVTKLILASIAVGLVMYFIAICIRYRDKEAVKKFNNS